MKTLISNYQFDASTGTVQLLGLNHNLSLEQILLITNVTKGVIIYNFASSGGTISNNALSLTYDTSLMSDDDALQIYIDYPEQKTTNAVWEGETTLYIGRADVGTLPNEAKWSICKREIDINGSYTEVWADGNSLEDNIWNNRTSLAYW